MSGTGGRIDLSALRERLAKLEGKRFWRSLEELAESPAFEEMLHREFPDQASEWIDPVGRRRFLQLMGASLALGGLTACTPPASGTIVPYVRQPEDLVPGKPLFFATAVTLGGVATGVLVESHMGRPTKLEGNPEHPASLGATTAITQAAILDLYDPDRSKTVTHLGEIRPYGDFVSAVREALAVQKARKGAGLRVLTGAVTSPTLVWQLSELLAEYPGARWHQHEPAGRENALAGAVLAFGEPAQAQYRFDRAEVVLSLDADFMGSGPGQVRYVRDFISKRRVRSRQDEMNRLYVIESTPSITGAKADHRWPLRASEIADFALAVAKRLAVDAGPNEAARAPSSIPEPAVTAIVRDLQSHRGRCLVLAGEAQPGTVHAAAHAINRALGNVGTTVVYTDPIEAYATGRSTTAAIGNARTRSDSGNGAASPRSVELRSTGAAGTVASGSAPSGSAASLGELVSDMAAGRVEMLVVLGGNPAYTAPADLRFAETMEKVPLRVHLGLYDDETAVRSHWHVPQAHDLESWSDARAHDGTVTILQPLIEPLYGGRTAHEVVAALGSRPIRHGREIVREFWKTRMPGGGDFERAWRRTLHDGLVAGTALPPKSVSLRRDWWRAPRSPSSGLEIVFRPDPAVHDGRFANNGWLQEMPRPLTKLTWDNAALVSPRTAERLGLAQEDLVDLRLDGRTVRAPVFVQPGHADESVTVHLGYGRSRTGKVGSGTGFDAYAIRSSGSPWIATGLDVARTGARYPLSRTQEHHSMEGRELVRAAGIEEFRRDPHFAHHGAHEPGPEMTLYPPHRYEGHSWGMAIDLSACVGCNACVVACQSENNIPIVGKDQVARNREMHWIRIDTYYEGGLDNPEALHQPVLCMHCENAPCELVCPVAATVHSSEGLNDMVYNRCVGTRYCSNNCPYKVRRFNFLEYADFETPSLKLMRNPDVTVRSRGVMEKCTYCVQRINHARNEAATEGRPMRDGDVTTACQQACPAEAIVFGDINDPKSRVSAMKSDPRNYGLLAELNTRPRTTYLAALRNPNPEIEGAGLGPATRTEGQHA